MLKSVLDFNSYVMNLTDVNLKGPGVSPVWTELYQAKKEYGLADLTPASMDGLFQRMLTDDAVFGLYYKYLSTIVPTQLKYSAVNFNYILVLKELFQERGRDCCRRLQRSVSLKPSL